MSIPPGVQYVDSGDSRIIFTIPPNATIPALSARAHKWLDGTQFFQDSVKTVTVPGTTFELSFYGRYVEVFGVTFPLNATTEPPQALYSIDNSTPFIADVPTVLGNTTTDVGVGFYRTDSLPLAYHLLVINVTNASGDSPYLLDYVAFDAYDVFPSPSSPPTSTSPDPSITSTASSLMPTGTTVAVSGSTGTRTISAGISAGVALGGAALLFVVLGSCIWLWRRSARSRRSQHEDAEQSGPLLDVSLYPRVVPAQAHVLSSSADASFNSPFTLDSYVRPASTESAGSQRVPPEEHMLRTNVSVIASDSKSARPSASILRSGAAEGSSVVTQMSSLGGVVSFDGKESRLTSGALPEISSVNGTYIRKGLCHLTWYFASSTRENRSIVYVLVLIQAPGGVQHTPTNPYIGSPTSIRPHGQAPSWPLSGPEAEPAKSCAGLPRPLTHLSPLHVSRSQTMYPADPTFVDNFDARIVYADPSEARQDDELSPDAHSQVDAISGVYNGTLSITTDPGMSFQFIFYGRILQIYGAALPWLSGQQPWAEYSIDDDGETQPVPSAPSPLGNVPLYVSTLLPLAFHTLTVKVINATSDGPFLFDYIAFGFLDASEDPNPQNSSSTSVASQSSITSLSSTSAVSITASATSATGSSPTSAAPLVTSPHVDSFPVAPVIGAIVGGIVALVAVAAVILCVWKRMSRRRDVDRESIEPASEPGPPEFAPTTKYVEKGSSRAPSPYVRRTNPLSWAERQDSGVTWPGPSGSPSSHRSALPREKAAFSVVESDARSSGYDSGQHQWDAQSHADITLGPDVRGRPATPGHLVSLERAQGSTGFVGPSPSQPPDAIAQAGAHTPGVYAGELFTQVIAQDRVPPPYSP
ncbi:uncharacterized protein TRAVEDRAFT_47628 [Trametes versicolor FP-101664 SS1]|uniref:uncharacterized protein n=1 Tax=Trametes versicolor (strain FP-101664) TaxID=717944 RepID=UPI0004624843|nr:uncharacterized protein TRAVEDRAFT_47628 [Trametes versicolor FP-101664 SS1]EIW58478.1 hypothetical protein TRAVEDRAFT_47628 [Trametes versicolor FP-101664 SS1]